MFGVGPGAARAIKPMWLVHAAETASLFYTTSSSLIVPSTIDAPNGNFGVGTAFPSEMDVGTERDMLS